MERVTSAWITSSTPNGIDTCRSSDLAVVVDVDQLVRAPAVVARHHEVGLVELPYTAVVQVDARVGLGVGDAARQVRDHQVEQAVARDVARLAAHRARAADEVLLGDRARACTSCRPPPGTLPPSRCRNTRTSWRRELTTSGLAVAVDVAHRDARHVEQELHVAVDEQRPGALLDEVVRARADVELRLDRAARRDERRLAEHRHEQPRLRAEVGVHDLCRRSRPRSSCAGAMRRARRRAARASASAGLANDRTVSPLGRSSTSSSPGESGSTSPTSYAALSSGSGSS